MKKVEIEQVSIRELIEKFEEVFAKNTQTQKKLIEYNSLDIPTIIEAVGLLKFNTVTLHHWAKKKVLVPSRIDNRVHYKKGAIIISMESINPNI